MSTGLGLQPAHPPMTTAGQPSTGKNIVICCDGTGNSYSEPNPRGPEDKQNGCNSNVVKLYTALEVSKCQAAYYHPGVGTMGAPTATHWTTKQWTRIKGLAFGAGFRDNVLDAYRYLMEVYSDNGGNGNEDRVFLFGFSRGAYTVRALAGLLHGYGLLCRGNEGHLPYAWRMYVQQHEDRRRNSVKPNATFKLTFSHQSFKIHFLGVWDTVSSVGWVSSPLKLFSVASNPSIVHARHAVSVDEHRCFFMDNLYDDKSGVGDVVQVWFAGVHSDVGGSYRQPEAGLANESLKWMLAEAKAHGLRTEPGKEAEIRGQCDAADPLCYKMPTSWVMHKSLRGLWWLAEFLPHSYYEKEFGKERLRVPFGVALRDLPPGALVHQSVLDRMKKPEPGAQQPYRPRNCPEAALEQAATEITGADGTTYRRFQPRERKRPRPAWLERTIVALTVLIEILVVAPVVVFVIALAVGVLVKVLLWIGGWVSVPGLWLWHLAPPWWHWLADWWVVAMRWLSTLG